MDKLCVVGREPVDCKVGCKSCPTCNAETLARHEVVEYWRKAFEKAIGTVTKSKEQKQEIKRNLTECLNNYMDKILDKITDNDFLMHLDFEVDMRDNEVVVTIWESNVTRKEEGL